MHACICTHLHVCQFLTRECTVSQPQSACGGHRSICRIQFLPCTGPEDQTQVVRQDRENLYLLSHFTDPNIWSLKMLHLLFHKLGILSVNSGCYNSLPDKEMNSATPFWHLLFCTSEAWHRPHWAKLPFFLEIQRENSFSSLL